MTMYLWFMPLIVSFYGPSLHNFPLIQIALGLSLSRVTDALRVIGGNVTVLQGDTVILPCKLTDTTETLNQISWQRETRRKPRTDNFYTIQQDDRPHFVNGEDKRIKFIGSITDKNGSLQFSDVTLLDEGIYKCIFTLFPSGNHKTDIPLNVLVPPVVSVTDNQPILGNEEVSLATCTAAGSKPPAEIKWVTDALTEKVKVQTNSTKEADGTTTTVSSLIGVPTREINHRPVQCVVTSPAVSKQETVSFIIQVYSLRVIGGNVTVLQGDTVILPCKLTDTTETLNQISWQRETRRKPRTDNFYTIQQDDRPHFVNGEDNRFKFIGSITDKNGSLQFSDVTLLDEGIYKCIFTLFPSGNHKTDIPLNVLVPPVVSVTDNQPILGNEEVSLATCTAAGSKPPAEIKWVTDALTEKVKVQTNSTKEADGTTTTVSSLIGVPTREINHRPVQCVVTSPAVSKQETLSFIIQVYFSPTEVNIIERSKDTFECVAEANPEANFTWSRSGQALPQSSVRVEGANLQLLSFTSDLNGLYQCEASNPYGRKHGQLYLHVTSGSCTVCWTLFSLLLCAVIAVAVAAAVWYHRKKSSSQEQSTPVERQRMQRATSENAEAPEETEGPV